MLEELLRFYQFHFDPHLKNGNEDYNDDDDCLLPSSGYSEPDSVLRALHTYSPAPPSNRMRPCFLSFRVFQMKGIEAQRGWINRPPSKGSSGKGLPLDRTWGRLRCAFHTAVSLPWSKSTLRSIERSP